MLLSRKEFSTLCCREISVLIKTSEIVEGQDAMDILTVSFTTLPESVLIIRPELKFLSDAGLSLVENAFIPEFVKVDSLSQPVIKFNLRKQVLGEYLVTFNTTGIIVDKYYLNFQGVQNQTSAMLKIVGTDFPLPAPKLSSAIYSKDGSVLSILFDKNTNRGGYFSSFTCSNLFQFPCAPISRCMWQNSMTVIAYVASQDVCAKPSDTLKLSTSALIKAMCTKTIGICPSQPSWENADTSSSVQIRGPEVLQLPTVVLSLPSTIGSCTSLSLDTTSSTGSGGRAWRNSSVIIQSSDDANSIELLQFLQANFQPTSPLVIPSHFFIAGRSYNFLVTLCNFLGACSQSNQKVSVLSTIVPVVTIPGSSLRTMKKSNVLSVLAQAQISVCEGDSNDIVPLAYSWTIYEGNRLDASLVTTSRDPSRLLLNAYSLNVMTMYRMVVTVFTGFQSAQSSIQVYVEEGEIKAIIKGGLATRSLRVGDAMSIDGSLSYDEDVRDIVGTAAGLLFEWVCMQSSPN